MTTSRLFRPLLRLAWLVLAATRAPAQGADDFENPPVSYSATTPHDVVARLGAALASGEAKLAGPEREIVIELLRRLGVPAASQLLVFSDTSFQRGRVRPDHPRAIYFSDDCYVGWVPGGLIEVTAIDATLGPVFYSFDPRGVARGSATPQFVRDPDCLRCHGGMFVREIPGLFARSVFPDAAGQPLLRFGSRVVDFRTPFEERWGGWYVTGRHGAAHHRGNSFAAERGEELVFDPAAGANREALPATVEAERYLAPGSDIVALLVFEHQLAVQNAITHAAFAGRRMLHYQASLQRSFKEPVTAEPAFDSVKSVLDTETRAVIDALLSHDEAPLPAGIRGDERFAAAYAAAGPRAADGASLRELSLAGHLYRNRCSPLIYAESFLALPPTLKTRIYAGLARALDPVAPDPRYAHLDAAERARIAAILRETHPELHDRWRSK